MKEAFKDILLEDEFKTPAPYFSRTISAPALPHKALAVIGVRRAGKTTFLRQLWDEFARSRHVGPERMLHVNFFDERLFGLKATQLGAILEAHYELHPELPKEAKLFLFLDEPQVVHGWEYFVDRLLRAGHRVYLSGSSATLLSREIASAMRGRSISIELFPFAFNEILTVENQAAPPSWGPRERAQVRLRFKRYLQEGGFPETLSIKPPMRRRLLQDYADTVVLRDVIERHNPSDPVAVMHLMHLLMNQISSLYTINKTCERLLAQGLKVNKTEISTVVEWLEDAYLFFSVPIFSRSAHKRQVNARKLYAVDTGMAYQFNASLSGDWGHLLENAFFLHLRRQTDEIFYFRATRQHEVDFVVKRNGRWELIQVAWSLKDPKTRQREIAALYAAMDELSLKQATLITFDEKEELNTFGHHIHVEPAWSYLANYGPGGR